MEQRETTTICDRKSMISRKKWAHKLKIYKSRSMIMVRSVFLTAPSASNRRNRKLITSVWQKLSINSSRKCRKSM